MIALILGLILTPGAASFPASAPVLHAGDTWHYKNTLEAQGRFSETHDESSIVRVTGDAMVVQTKQVDSTLQPSEVLLGSDWSRFRSIDGKEQVVFRPFAFPLEAAKTWTVDFTEPRPSRDRTSEHVVATYHVVGTERVTVPAGSFDAIKIEATGRWSATIAPGTTGSIVAQTDEVGAAIVNRIDRRQPGEATGRLYKAIWYAPAVRRAVKVVEESYSSGGVRSDSRTSELESFKPGG